MKNLMFPFLLVYVLFLVSSVKCAIPAGLETVDDDELMNLVRHEKYVVVLFTKKDCQECDQYENELTHLREDLVDALNAWVVKAHNSQLVKLYKPTKEPALVFFRHGIPLLYDGQLNDELILHTFNSNKEPTVKELSDENFEHLTQASSGATTGDWFVMFYSTDCLECQRLQATWEAVGAKLKSRMTVARINKQTTGAVTGRRFGVAQVPAFIYFRLGKMYRYNIPRYDINSFTAFVTDWYKNAKMEIVPVPKSPFDDFTQMIADYLRDYPLVWQAASASFILVVVLYVAISLLSKKKKPELKKSKKSK